MILPRREPGGKQRRKKSALSDRLLMLPGREPGKKQRRGRRALSVTGCKCFQQENHVRERVRASVFTKILWVIKSIINYGPNREWVSAIL